MPSKSERFLADAMLERLARWLRVLGADTTFNPAWRDRELVDIAAEEERILLTRDRHLVRHLRPRHAILLVSQAPLQQLREVVEACDLSPPDELFTRCLICNGELRPATEEERIARVPERARERGGPVSRCPDCGRVYWTGSHVREMRAALRSAFPDRWS